MKLSEIIRLVQGAVLNPEALVDHEIIGGCGADLMTSFIWQAG